MGCASMRWFTPQAVTIFGELLVKNGLARIYGVRTPLPDGRTSRQYLARLAELEEQAKAERLGGWRRRSEALTVVPTPSLDGATEKVQVQ